MQNETYALKTILDTISKYKKQEIKKRLIFNKAPVGGIASKWIITFFILIPFMEYAVIFNPYVFNLLGIAQAIIFFVVFLSIVMILIFTLASLNNASVVKKITPSWNHYFPDIDLKLIVTSSVTPYKDFFKHYGAALNKELENEALHRYLKEAFVTMQTENKDLLEAMKKNRSK